MKEVVATKELIFKTFVEGLVQIIIGSLVQMVFCTLLSLIHRGHYIDGGWFRHSNTKYHRPNDCQSSVTQLVEIGQTPNPGEDLDVAPICSNFSAQADTSITLIFTPEPFGGGGIDYFYIDWGLGDTLLYTPPPIVPTFDITSPDYSNLGSYPINIDLYGLNGCVNSISSELFIGSNPQLGSTSPGNTTGLCSPVEITYPVYDFQNNGFNNIYNTVGRRNI